MELEQRLFAMVATPVVFVNVNEVELDDLLGAVPGRIVRCYTDPNICVKWVDDQDQPALGCVAGWISEAE